MLKKKSTKKKSTKKKATKKKRPSTKLARPRSLRWVLRIGWLFPVGALLVGASLLVLTYAFASIPLPQEIPLSSSAEVYDRDGRLIGTYTGEVRRFLLDREQLEDLPDYIEDAVISSEDKDFYKHNGVSLRGIVRAAWANFSGGEIQQGGSTITQQYIKQAVLQDPSRTIVRKAKEVVLAIKLERRHSKKEILGFYLNTIYLGRGAYGFEAAARTYFDKHASELSLSQAAYLASIIPAPESYQPDENRRGASERRDRVLAGMVRDGHITAKQLKRASRFPVRMADGLEERTTRTKAAYFMEWLRKEYLYPEYGNELYTRGLKIYTTLDLDMQRYAEDAVDSILTEPEDPQAALVSMTPTGAVRAMVGGEHYTSVRKSRNFNYATDYPGRHTGSSFKSFTLAAAIEDDISPTSSFSGSSPAFIEECPGENGLPPWEVSNYGGGSYGTMSLDSATTNSVNTIYAQLIAEIGAEKVANLLEDFEFHPPSGKTGIPPNCSLALGAFDATVLEMARGYATFAGRGLLPEVQPIRYIDNARERMHQGVSTGVQTGLRGPRQAGIRAGDGAELRGRPHPSADACRRRGNGDRRKPRRAPRRRQDRYRTGEQGRLVRGLRPTACDRGVDGIPAPDQGPGQGGGPRDGLLLGSQPLPARARHRGNWGELPGSDLGCIHGSGHRRDAGRVLRGAR